MAASPRIFPRLALITLPVFVLLVALERWHTYSEPLERDITTYAVIGQGLLTGRDLYTDLWDHKPPAVFLTFALAEALAGYGQFMVYFLNLVTVSITILGLYLAGFYYAGPWCGIIASGFWAVLSGDLYTQSNQPNTELFINLFSVWAFALWLGGEVGKWEFKRWIAIGCLLAIGSLYKPFVVVCGVFLAFPYVLAARKNTSDLRRSIGQITVSFLAIGTFWALAALYFFCRGHWRDFFSAVFVYNENYSRYSLKFFLNFFAGIFHSQSKIAFALNAIENFIAGVSQDHFDPTSLSFVLPLLSCGVAGAFLERRQKTQLWSLWIFFLISVEVEIFFTGVFHPHYYQLYLPPLVIGGAWGAFCLGERLVGVAKRGWWIPAAIVFIFLIIHERPYYSLSPEEWSKNKYAEGDLFIQSYRAAQEINRILLPDETFYEWGNESGLYFASGRRPPTGVFYGYPLFYNPLAEQLTDRVLNDLKRTKPELFIFYVNYQPEGWLHNPIIELAWNEYNLLPGNPRHGPFIFLARKNGALIKRLSNNF